MTRYHPISSYNKHLCLKPNLVMWLIFIFLSRPYIVAILSLANRKNKVELIDMIYPDRLTLSVGALAAVPAALLVYAWVRRAPGASSFVRNIWAKGRILLSAAALLSGAVIFVPFWLRTEHVIPVRDWVQAAISLLIVGIVYMSPYIRDCFNDFPADEAPPGK